MRRGVNPNKHRAERNVRGLHRVIFVCHLPAERDDYHAELDAIIARALASLFASLDPRSRVTFIDNGSDSERLAPLVAPYRDRIDKWVRHRANRGKVYALLSEARAVYEPFVTFADCDVLFRPGWERAVFDVFATVPRAGAVCPLPVPRGAFIGNKCLFLQSLWGRVRHAAAVTAEDLRMLCQGLDNPAALDRKPPHASWAERQIVYRRDGQSFLVGVCHFVATYRSSIFRGDHRFPEMKFENAYEASFIDALPDRAGLFGLSTRTTYAYHMGNRLDEVAERLWQQAQMSRVSGDHLPISSDPQPWHEAPRSRAVWLQRALGALAVRLYWNR